MRKALGRGLDALIPGAGRSTQPASDDDRTVPIELIRPNPRQPRTHFDDGALDELAASIRAKGVIQPLLVRPLEGGYELVAGERRLPSSGPDRCSRGVR
jgi:ParB family transcriptional regulator, chromosome partitioning protein